MTKKCLVRFDPAKPKRQSKDFLVIHVEDGMCHLLGSSSGEVVEFGLVVFVGRELVANDLFVKLVDTGRKITSVDDALETLREYLVSMKALRVGQIVRLVDRSSGGFELEAVPKSNFGQKTNSPSMKRLP